jgi:hypothetical protein
MAIMSTESPTIEASASRDRDAWDGAALIVAGVGLVVFGLVGCWLLVALGSVLPSAAPRTTVEWAVRIAWMLVFMWMSGGILVASRKSSHWVRGRIARRWSQAPASRSRTETIRTFSIVATVPVAGLLFLMLAVAWHLAWSVMLRALIAMGSR